MRLIGRKDKIDIPDLKLFNVEAKVDTGAYGSAIHCHHIEVVEKDGEPVLSFDLLDPEHPEYEKEMFHFTAFGQKVVKSTNGEAENRYTIETRLVVFEQEYLVEFSLTNRADMKTPVLLGRKFLRNRYLVDVDKKDLSYKDKNENSSTLPKP